MKTIIAFLILFSTQIHAQEAWICTDESLQHVGSVWQACGVGEAGEEGQARKRALENALSDFKEICKLNTSCSRGKISAEPKRTTCSCSRTWCKCYRMIEVTVD